MKSPSDLDGLPLFDGVPAVEPQPSKKRRSTPPAATAAVLPFPPSRDQRLIADLAKAFISLRSRHGRVCRAMLLDKRFRPIATKLRRMGVQALDVEAELVRLEKAVARVVWIHDGRPDCSSGGGSAA